MYTSKETEVSDGHKAKINMKVFIMSFYNLTVNLFQCFAKNMKSSFFELQKLEGSKEFPT